MTIGAFLFLIIPHLGFQRVIRVTGFIEVENTRIFQRCADWISSESCANALHRSKCLRVEIRG